jgi:hypothetical protein
MTASSKTPCLTLSPFGRCIAQFKTELTEKVAKLDTDPHLWMAFTLDKDAYVRLMKQKVRYAYPSSLYGGVRLSAESIHVANTSEGIRLDGT